MILLALLLAGCGNDPLGNDYASVGKGVLAALTAVGKTGAPTLESLDAQGIATLRVALEQDGQPIVLVVNPSLKYQNLMAPYGQNGDVQTWASMQYETIALRDGMLVATRGFGPDLMTSTGPTAAQIATGKGATTRHYYHLDGGDHPRSFDYSCTLSQAGSEAIVVLGKGYQTRKIIENCQGSAEPFSNVYWFDKGSNIRQSSQWTTPGLANVILQRVID